MRKQLRAVGNSTGLILDRPILELLGLSPDSEVELRVEGKELIVSRAPVETKRARSKRLLDEAQRRALSVEGNRKVLTGLAKR
jgi:antitoxin component of MazEF toxin-antitoxin module